MRSETSTDALTYITFNYYFIHFNIFSPLYVPSWVGQIAALMATLVENKAVLVFVPWCTSLPILIVQSLFFRVLFINTGHWTPPGIVVPVDLRRSIVVYLRVGLRYQISGISSLIGELHAVHVHLCSSTGRLWNRVYSPLPSNKRKGGGCINHLRAPVFCQKRVFSPDGSPFTVELLLPNVCRRWEIHPIQ